MSAGVYPPGAKVGRSALLDPTGAYRYVLGRRWAPDGPVLAFVMLNPSTADAELDDPTIRRCVGFAVREGAAAIRVLNLYAYRATKPGDLFAAKAAGVDVVGPRNADYLLRHVAAARDRRDPVVVAWGAHARADRVAEFVDGLGVWTDALYCLGYTGAGQPRHPLMLAADTPLEPYRHAS